MKLKTNKLFAGLFCSLCIATTAHADDTVAVFMTSVNEAQHVTLSAGQLRADIEQGIMFAIASAGATFSDGKDRFDFNAVARDTLAKAGVGIGITTLAYTAKYGKATVEAVASRIGTDFAAGALVAVSQEYLQIHLQNRWNVPKQVAKWSAFALANIAGGSWAYWAQPYIEYQLVEHFNGVHLNATSSGRRRDLLQITTAESFANKIRTIPMVSSYGSSEFIYGERRHNFYGAAVSAHGTRYTYAMWMDVPSDKLELKKVLTCKFYPGKARECRTMRFI